VRKEKPSQTKETFPVAVRERHEREGEFSLSFAPTGERRIYLFVTIITFLSLSLTHILSLAERYTHSLSH